MLYFVGLLLALFSFSRQARARLFEDPKWVRRLILGKRL
jgi:hypothetical protein